MEVRIHSAQSQAENMITWCLEIPPRPTAIEKQTQACEWPWLVKNSPGRRGFCERGAHAALGGALRRAGRQGDRKRTIYYLPYLRTFSSHNKSECYTSRQLGALTGSAAGCSGLFLQTIGCREKMRRNDDEAVVAGKSTIVVWCVVLGRKPALVLSLLSSLLVWGAQRRRLTAYRSSLWTGGFILLDHVSLKTVE